MGGKFKIKKHLPNYQYLQVWINFSYFVPQVIIMYFLAIVNKTLLKLFLLSTTLVIYIPMAN